MTNYVSDLVVPYLISNWSLLIFVIIVSIYVIGMVFLLEFVKRRSKEIRKKDSYIRLIHVLVTGAQFFLIAISIFVVGQIFLTSQYHIGTLIAVTAISQILTIGILCLFSQRFFSWFRTNSKSIVVLLYGSSFAIQALSLTIVSLRELYLLFIKEPIITAASKVIFPYDYIAPGSFLDNIWFAYQYTDILSFILLISATAILLSHYSAKLGKVKFWIVIALPLLYYLSATIELFGIYTPTTDSEWFWWWLYVSLNSTAGGVLFGIAYMSIAKSLRHDSAARQYLIIAAYGFILMFISNQITLVGASYPPYGLVTLSCLGLAAYMIFLGLYSTAISVAQDNQLRKSIKKYATENSNLLGSIGTAQMEREIRKTVNSMKSVVAEQEKELEEQTGIEANLGEDEMKNYLEEVMQEVGKARKPPST